VNALSVLQYYYNSQTQQYLYWDGERQTYLPAPTSGTDNTSAASCDAGASNMAEQEAKKEDDQKKKQQSPERKVKIAKRIVKVS
jgi:RNA-binding protein 5/10